MDDDRLIYWRGIRESEAQKEISYEWATTLPYRVQLICNVQESGFIKSKEFNGTLIMV